MTYTISCAGCGVRFSFRSMERIGLRVRKHVCHPKSEERRDDRHD